MSAASALLYYKFRGEFFLCYVTALKTVPTNHIYIRKYRNFLSFDISQSPHVLKTFVDCTSYTIMLK